MHVEAGPLRQPGLDLGVLVGAVVVDDQVQKAQELLLPVPGLAFGDHCTGSHIQCGKQGCGAMADVVMGHPLDVAQSHGQQRLGAVRRLNLRFFRQRRARLRSRVG